MTSEESSKRERELIRKRAPIKGNLTRFQKILNTPDEPAARDVEHLRSRISTLERDLEVFYTIHDELEQLASDDMFEFRLAERLEFSTSHDEAVRRARNLIHELRSANSQTTCTTDNNIEPRVEIAARMTPHNGVETSSMSPATVSYDTNIKVHKMDLPKFSGSYEAWPGFSAAFKSAVHNNNKFQDSEKLMYLQSCLIGKAAEKVESLSPTSANYLVAWDLLERSYHDPVALINNRVKALFDLPACVRANATSIGELVDAASKHYRALQASSHAFLEAFPIYTVTSKLDAQTHLRWKERVQENPSPTMDDLLEFLRVRHKVLEDSRFDKPSDRVDKTRDHKRPTERTRPTFAYAATDALCHICKESHFTNQCPELTRVDTDQRFEVVKRAGLCTNCLRPGHVAKQCNNSTCRKCRARHNTLLHREPFTTHQSNTVQANVATFSINCIPEVLLPTAVIHIQDQNGLVQSCRMLLDSGSQSNFLSEHIVAKLGLSRTSIDVPVVGINHIASRISSMVTTHIKSRINKFNAKLTFLILPQITESLPSQILTRAQVQIPENLPLADPEFRNPSQIDGILGAEIFYDLLCIGQMTIANSTAKLQKTKLGWVASGRIARSTQSQKRICNMSLQSLAFDLSKLWELEEPPRQAALSNEESACEIHYRRNTTREVATGRYVVQLPFNKERQNLGDSYSAAFQRFHSLERSFIRNPDLKIKYTEFMNEYCQLGHMTRLDNPCVSEGYYLPHHAVLKQSSVTTKLRVVFDASAKSSSGVSLNDTLMVGPTIQDDLCSILLRFRMHSYVLTADIAKMYRQVLIHPKDRRYQKILWRANPQERLETYALNTVTYGTSAAPFLAIRSLHQVAEQEGDQFPKAATILREDFYVDDLLTGTNTYTEAKDIVNEMIQLCNKAGFKIRQWASNDERLLNSITDKTDDNHVRLDLDETIKTLGLHWNARQDNIFYTIANLDSSGRVTKRTILSQTASLFDPLGLLGPIIIQAKMMIQSLWQLKLDWDESVPAEIHTTWTQFCQELPLLRALRFERQVTAKEFETIHLHGFCDASQRAYGACLYIRSVNKAGTITTRLWCSKSRVAPLKTVTLPRLELCAAHLLAKLYKATRGALRKLSFATTTFWSDSTITLHWINTPPHLLKTFVSHRIADIQAWTDKTHWRHVASQHNPADMISRGVKPRELLKNTLWHSGPTWLKEPESNWPTSILEPTDIPETRPTIALSMQLAQWDTLSKFSSYHRLRRILAYCLRFIRNASRQEKLTGPLSVNELQLTEIHIIKIVQREGFSKEMHSLQSADSASNSLTPLNPFIDNEGILRVGGRLHHATLPYQAKHPILIPRDHPITKLIIRDKHLTNFHAGALATLNAVRQRFWIPNGRALTRQIIHKCIRCHKARPSIPNYVMGNLPRGRLQQTRPFLHTGVDYCGPIYIKEKAYRNKNKLKVYLAIFVCFSTRAIHIEIVSNLTTEAFLAALRRFFSRRGRSSDIYCDNATNFVGAKRELKELYSTIKTQTYNDTIAETLSNDGITWHFIPPRSPHFGGLWEAAVKSTKHHLTRVIGDTLLSYEALLTYVNQIEAILNSRPITPLSSDPNDMQALTPSHFLIGDVLTNMPDYKFAAIPSRRLSMWQHVQQLQQHFWTRWVKEYLQEHTVRKKWHLGRTTAIKLGELVLLREDNVPPMKWSLGRITALHTGDDGVVRTVTVKTIHGTYKRCVKKLSPLPLDDQ